MCLIQKRERRNDRVFAGPQKLHTELFIAGYMQHIENDQILECKIISFGYSSHFTDCYVLLFYLPYIDSKLMRVFAFRAGVILAQPIQKHFFPIRAYES